jgi:hypothetical protein
MHLLSIRKNPCAKKEKKSVFEKNLHTDFTDRSNIDF